MALIVNVQFNRGGSQCQDRGYLVTVYGLYILFRHYFITCLF